MDSASATDIIDNEDIQLLIEIALFNMPKQQREVFTLYQEGLTNDEIAEKLNTTKSVVAQQLYKSRKRISELLLSILAFLLA